MATRDTQVSGANSSTTPINVAITINASATLCIVEISGAPATTSTSAGASRVTGVAIDGNAFTAVYADPGSGGVIAGEVWALLNPPTGAKTIVITRAAAGFAPICYTAKTYIGGDTAALASALSAVARQTASSTNSSPYVNTVSLTGTVDEITESFCCAASSHSVVATTAASQTQDGTATDGNSAEQRSGYAVGTGAPFVHSYDLQADTSGRLAYTFSFIVRNAAAGGGGAGGAAAKCFIVESRMAERMVQ